MPSRPRSTSLATSTFRMGLDTRSSPEMRCTFPSFFCSTSSLSSPIKAMLVGDSRPSATTSNIRLWSCIRGPFSCSVAILLSYINKMPIAIPAAPAIRMYIIISFNDCYFDMHFGYSRNQAMYCKNSAYTTGQNS